MPDILIRNLPDEIVRKLKSRARRHKRSLQAEVKIIVEEGVARVTVDEFCARLQRFHARLGTRHFDDSTALIREDRER